MRSCAGAGSDSRRAGFPDLRARIHAVVGAVAGLMTMTGQARTWSSRRVAQERLGTLPGEHLVDGGVPTHESIEEAQRRGVTMHAPVQKPKKEGVDPYQPKAADSPAVASWRQRMGTPEAKFTQNIRGDRRDDGRVKDGTNTRRPLTPTPTQRILHTL